MKERVMDTPTDAVAIPKNFIEEIIDATLEQSPNTQIITRFPPEPNGYLHIGHAKSICLNFGIAKQYHSKCNLRFDDTNPAKEDQEYVDSITQDVKWLVDNFPFETFFASDYFDTMYEIAIKLIKKNLAYVCDLDMEETRVYRGSTFESGKNSPFRERSIEENLTLFEQMKAGLFPDGAKTLRAKIDMSHPNIYMRDPVLYRIVKKEHHRQGNKWAIYPMYDFAHPLEDAIEGISHSICTLEFEIHRPLYDWVVEHAELPSIPHQYEFARLNLAYTVMSKRKLLQLVQEKKVASWDDPRMPTVSGMRRRGIPASAIRKFCEKIGVTKFNSLTDVALLDYCVREELNQSALRMMAVLNPVKVVVTNFPEGHTEWIEAQNNPENATDGTRLTPFTRELWIEQEDFMEEPPKKYFRLAPGQEVRLRYGFVIKCENVLKDANGKIIEIQCTYDPDTRGGNTPDGRKIKGTIHWVSAQHATPVEVRLYDRLFTHENPAAYEGDPFDLLNPDSLKILTAFVEPELTKAQKGRAYQFERVGYFTLDDDSAENKLVFNRTVTLKDTWAKLVKE